ncbi:uncharacterized protein LOC102468005 isoform X2 [Tupaia chinensis]|uniref:uncharacterized protein LOC102468005 isoform X2 n=1 Tax=Tupaia chinensis TaxID=246437 RepID=UPI000FFC0AFE|nr:uncharacterized protein LOC102468005 isoform X2 [Tupaia chinensis]
MHLLPAAEGTQALLPATGSSRSSIPGGAREGVLGLRDTQGRLCVCGESHQALRGAVEKLQNQSAMLKACHRGGGVHQPAGAGQDDEGGEMNSATLAKSALRILFSLHKEKPGRDVLTAAEKPTALLRELQNPRSVLAWAATPPPLLLLD